MAIVQDERREVFPSSVVVRVSGEVEVELPTRGVECFLLPSSRTGSCTASCPDEVKAWGFNGEMKRVVGGVPSGQGANVDRG